MLRIPKTGCRLGQGGIFSQLHLLFINTSDVIHNRLSPSRRYENTHLLLVGMRQRTGILDGSGKSQFGAGNGDLAV